MEEELVDLPCKLNIESGELFCEISTPEQKELTDRTIPRKVTFDIKPSAISPAQQLIEKAKEVKSNG